MSQTSAWTCMVCDKPVRHVGPSLLLEGTEMWVHDEPTSGGHLIRPMETIIVRSASR